MQHLIIANIGDGLCGAAGCGQDWLHIDCGDGKDGTKSGQRLLHMWNTQLGGSAIAISHFHADHVNGLFNLWLRKQNGESIIFDYQDVYYPQVPSTPTTLDLHDKVLNAVISVSMLDLLLMSLGWFPAGSRRHHSRIIIKDALGVLSDLCRQPPALHALCRDRRTFTVGDTDFDILWPPCSADADLTKRMQKLADAFDQAKKASPTIQAVAEENAARLASDYPNVEGINVQPLLDGLVSELANVSEIVKALRPLHNALSLAFRAEDEFIFFGDVTKSGVKEIVSRLQSPIYVLAGGGPITCGVKKVAFKVMVSPHHGTKAHWADALTNLDISQQIVHSIGPGLTLSGPRSCKYEKHFPGLNWWTEDDGEFDQPIT